jgi:hypothetical protein
MNVNRAIGRQNHNKTISIAGNAYVIDRTMSDRSASVAPAVDSTAKIITGRVLALYGEGDRAVAGAQPIVNELSLCNEQPLFNEQPLGGVQVDLYAVSSLNDVAEDLPPELLTHCRMLLLDKPAPVDLYGELADTPLIGFDHIVRLPEIPGYEMLVAAAKSHDDASFKQQLRNNPTIFRRLLCYYHPGLFSDVCSTSVITDAAGSFRFTVEQCANVDEQVGYRFAVRRPISSSLYVMLYDPSPAAWYTRWDWSDTDNVVLRTCHPFAVRVQPPR